MKQGREHLGLTQQEAAAQLGVSQPYLSLLEAGARRVPAKLAKKAAKVYGAAPTALPLDESFKKPGLLQAQRFAEDLAALGYPGFSYLHSTRRRNPAVLLLEALAQSDLEGRLVEALPWLVLRYPQLDWEWLVPRTKLYNLQNRLGYVADLAYKVAENKSVEPFTLSIWPARRPHWKKLDLSWKVRSVTILYRKLSGLGFGKHARQRRRIGIC
jgi:transcriptional regulator with XRE-family HTH domain